MLDTTLDTVSYLDLQPCHPTPTPITRKATACEEVKIKLPVRIHILLIVSCEFFFAFQQHHTPVSPTTPGQRNVKVDLFNHHLLSLQLLIDNNSHINFLSSTITKNFASLR